MLERHWFRSVVFSLGKELKSLGGSRTPTVPRQLPENLAGGSQVAVGLKLPRWLLCAVHAQNWFQPASRLMLFLLTL